MVCSECRTLIVETRKIAAAQGYPERTPLCSIHGRDFELTADGEIPKLDIDEQLAWELYCQETDGSMDVRDHWEDLPDYVQQIYLQKVANLHSDE
jgi:hypothetical protein